MTNEEVVQPRYEIDVLGRPHGQGSMSVVNRRTGKMRHPQSTIEWRTVVTWEFKRHRIVTLKGPVLMECRFFFRRPKSHTKQQALDDRGWRDKTPDLDKLVRAIGDAATAAGIIHDDGQIVRIVADMIYSDVEGCRIIIGPVTGPAPGDQGEP